MNYGMFFEKVCLIPLFFLSLSSSVAAEWTVVQEREGSVTYSYENGRIFLEVVDFGKNSQMTMNKAKEIYTSQVGCEEEDEFQIHGRQLYHYMCPEYVHIYLTEKNPGSLLQLGGICNKGNDCDAVMSFVADYIKKLP